MQPSPLTLCNITQQIIEAEFNLTELTTKQRDSTQLSQARYLYVYVCHSVLNVPFPVIRNTLTCYQYSKTIYQVFRRAYYRRKEPEFSLNVLWIEKRVRNELKRFKT